MPNHTQTPYDADGAEEQLANIESEIVEEDKLRVKLTPFTLTALYAREFPEARWLAEGLIPLGGITAVTGEPRSFKSFVMQDLAACVSTGKPFLGQFPTTKGKVLILDEENSARLVQDRFKTLNVRESDDILFISQAGVKLDTGEVTDKLVEIVNEVNPTLVILDSLVRFHSGEENSAKDMARLFEGVKKLVSDERAVVFIHHHRKQYGPRSESTQNIRGSSDIFAQVDCHLAINRKAKDLLTVSQTKLRMREEMDRFKAALVHDENGAVTFAYQGVDNDENEEMIEAQEKIKEVLARATEPIGVDVLASETEVPKSRIRKAIKELVDEKEVVETKAAHNKSIYALPDKSDVEAQAPEESSEEVEKEEVPDISNLPF